MSKDTRLASAMSSLMLPVVSMTKQSAEAWERPINLQERTEDGDVRSSGTGPQGEWTRDTFCRVASYCRNLLSPTATLSSSSRSIVARTAKSAALGWSEPWLDLTVSLLMPPTGSVLLVLSKNPPWLHLPYSQWGDLCLAHCHTVTLCSKDAADVFKLPGGFSEEKRLKYPEVSSPCSSSSGRILSSQLSPLQFLQVGVFMSAVKASQGVSACTIR